MPPAAKQNDLIQAVDQHNVTVGAPPVPAVVPLPFSGPLTTVLSENVFVEKQKAATVGSTADNTPPHPNPPPGTNGFVIPPTNKGVVRTGSGKVFVNQKAAARAGDPADTCSDLPPVVPGQVVSTTASVFFA